MDDLTLTTDAIEIHQWHVVLLAPRAKRPQGQAWQVVQNPSVARYHVQQGGNLGLVCGPDSRVAVLDFDVDGAMLQMAETLGPLQPWVQTKKGFHCYVAWEDNLPAKIFWQGTEVGQVQRGPALQHVVMPPSIHPETGLPYAWLVDPTVTRVPDLPDEWRRFLREEPEVDDGIPEWMERGPIGHPAVEPWRGPSPTILLFRASQQPGARRRRNGVKFQCPGCRQEGHDRSKDNAIVYDDGRWGCAIDPEHKKDIAEALGFYDELHQAAKETVVLDPLTLAAIQKLNG